MAASRAILVPAALIGVAAIVSVIGVGGHAGQTVVVVGDSLTAAGTSEIMTVLSADGWKPIVEGVSGSSMTNRNQVFDWRDRLAAFAAFPPDVVVIELGTNDCGNCGDDVAAAIDGLMRPLRHVRRVLWLTAQTQIRTALDPVGVNEALRQATVRWPNLEVLDMGAYLDGHPEWHTADGVHLNEMGSSELGRFIRNGIDSPPSRVGALSSVI